ncbi:MAG: efflux RND transporter periplasmic adaptor subunit [candidate division KSB1 bacterium]|nr:efflux RND transporter periplasmic adaptor subunit [candidate division KSB1 bacterium]MDZ7412027.1 efflux RND transporter periplasmic adaptor subunit [candidate division KSB1 bacterium]
MTKKKRTVVFLLGLVAVVVAAVVLGSQSARKKAVEVTVAPVKRGTITQVVSGSGKVQPELKVNIAAHVAGKIVELPVREGQQVRRGQLLVRLEKEQYQAAVERARSTLKSARANLTKTRAEYERAKELYAQKLTSLAQLQTAEAALMLAESEVEQAQASLNQAEDNLDKTTITSPIDGTVIKLNKEVGEITLGSQFQADVIMEVADLERMEVVAEIDENDVVDVVQGQSARIQVDAIPDTVLRGRVREVAHTAITRGRGTQEEITNFEVKVSVVDRVPQLRPGMSATVEIETKSKDQALYVPIQCITMRSPEDTTQIAQARSTTWRRKKGGTRDESMEGFGPPPSADEESKKTQPAPKQIQVVFVVENGVAKMRPVVTGISSETDIEIVSGLNEGEQVVSGSYRVLSKELKNGTAVKVSSGKPASQKK